MGPSDYVHLHVHSDFSLLDGAAKLDELVKKAKTCGQTALALTDHGTLSGIVSFYKECKKNEIKPLLGCEAYIALGDAPGAHQEKTKGYNHLTLIAKNDEGYKNLSRLASIAYLEGFYYRPRMSVDLLRKYRGGLMALSGCVKGPISVPLIEGDAALARKEAEKYKEIFGEDFYLEIQPNSLDEQKTVNEGLLRLSKELSIKSVATCDLHYVEPADAEAQEIRICISSGKTLKDESRLQMKSEFYFRTSEEMQKSFAHVPEAILATREIAEKTGTIDLLPGTRNTYFLPKFNTPDGTPANVFYRKLAQEGLRKRYGNDPSDALQKRLEYELSVMEKMGFVDYFLIVQDFINWAKSNGCPVGPGRGSAAGSLVAYCIGITDIDPIKYDLLFERFLNPDRVSMPDIDVDFCEANRWKAIDYVRKKYGEANVCQIITFGTLKAKAVIRDVGRVLDIPLPEVDRIAKLVPEGPKTTLESALAESPDLAKLREDPAFVRLFDLAIKLEGVNRHAGKHAAGVVISDKDLLERIPLTRVGSGDEQAVTTQYTMTEVEEAGLLKMDFLGLRTLTLITDCLALIKKTRGIEVDEGKIPIDDKKAFELLARGDTRGVFQLESSGFRELLVRSKPDRFEDIIALLALYRPGPLGSGMDVQFVNRKHGKEPITYEHPLLEPILNETYGCFLYQEQVMRLANKVAGFTLAEADTLRKAMGKKKVDLMEKYRVKFVEGCGKNGLTAEKATTIWEQIVKFAEYGFNKSHSAAYGLVTYRTAYLKANFPAEFMAATLTSWSGDTEKLVEYVDECKRMGLPLKAPDVNEGIATFDVKYVNPKAAKKGTTRLVGKNGAVNGAKARGAEGASDLGPTEAAEIIYGLEAIRGVGSGAIAHVLEARQKAGGRFRSIFHFCEEVDAHAVNRATLEALVKAGAFHSTGARRSQLSAVLEQAIQIGAQTQRDRLSKQASLFGVAGAEEETKLDAKLLPEIPEWKDADLLAREKEALGFYLSSHPLEAHRETIERFSTAKTADLAGIAAETQVTIGGLVSSLRSKPDKRGNLMAFVTLEDFAGTVDGVVFGSIYPEVRDHLKVDAPVFLQGKLDRSRDQPSIRVDSVIPAAEAEGRLRVAVMTDLVIEDTTEVQVLKLRDLFAARRGDDSVFYTFKRKSDGATAGPFKVGAHMRVTGNDALRREILEILGPSAQVRIGAQVVGRNPT